MEKLLRFFYLTARDLGAQPYTITEIADKMKHGIVQTEDGLSEFATVVCKVFEASESCSSGVGRADEPGTGVAGVKRDIGPVSRTRD
jgi:hypothetical protein